jgi:hypothetical protein
VLVGATILDLIPKAAGCRYSEKTADEIKMRFVAEDGNDSSPVRGGYEKYV